jgi:hypothetical protein
MAVSMEVECPVAGCGYVRFVTYPSAKEWERESREMMQQAILDQEHPRHRPDDSGEGATGVLVSN